MMSDPLLVIVRWIGLAPDVRIHPDTRARLDNLDAEIERAKRRLDAIEDMLNARAAHPRLFHAERRRTPRTESPAS